MPAQHLPGAAPAGRRIRIRSRIRLPPRPEPEPTRPVQQAAATVGAVFGLLGLIGFLPGITAHVDDMTVVGEQTTTVLFGLFAVSVLHNVIHLGYAVAGLAMATSVRLARWYLIIGGAGHLLLALLGITPAAGIVPLNPPDNWLHLVLGAGMLVLALLTALFSRAGAGRR